MTDQEIWGRVYAASITGQRSAESRDLGGGESMPGDTGKLSHWAAEDADAALAQYKKRFSEPNTKPAIKRFNADFAARRLELARDRLAMLERMVSQDNPQIDECKAEIARLEGLLTEGK